MQGRHWDRQLPSSRQSHDFGVKQPSAIRNLDLEIRDKSSDTLGAQSHDSKLVDGVSSRRTQRNVGRLALEHVWWRTSCMHPAQIRYKLKTSAD